MAIHQEYRDFCERDAQWYETKAREAREADPETYYKESLRCAQILCHVLPVIVKKSLESDEFKAKQQIYTLLHNFKRFTDGWNSAAVTVMDLLKGFIRISSKAVQDVTEFIRLRRGATSNKED